MKVCPQCGTQMEDDAVFCDNCGTKLPEAGVTPSPASSPVAGDLTCPQCGASIVPGEAYCENCGAALASAPVEPVAPVAQPAAVYPSAGPPAAPPPPVAAITTCPQCGANVNPGDVFCDNCGAALGAAPAAQPPAAYPPAGPAVAPSPPVQPGHQPPVQPVTVQPYLVVQASGARLAFPPGKAEILIGREDPVSNVFPEIDLSPHGGDDAGISRRHAKITIQGNQCFIEDMNSTNYTFVNKQKLAPGVRHPLNDGDEVRLGRMVLTFHK